LGTSDQLVCINLGCGSSTHDSWKNLDINPYVAGVEKWDSRNGIPAATNSVDIVYHSHLLEHLHQEDGEKLTKECYRILKPNGVLHIAVPDLEQICREYLNARERLDRR